MAVIGFFGGIVGQIQQRWQERLTDAIDERLRLRLTRFEHRYRQYMLESLRFVDLRGLATIGFYTPELDEVFVEVSLAYQSPHRVPTGLLGSTLFEGGDRHSIGEFLDSKAGVVLALIGGPGSGKTTLLRYTARQVSRGRKIAILLYARDHALTIKDSPGISLAELVSQWIPASIRQPNGWFERRLRRGDCVVLLDGLDEVAHSSIRRDVADWIEGQAKLYPRNDYVITSRPQGYRMATIDGAIVLQVRSFTDKQVETFVRGWYAAVERHNNDNSRESRVRIQESADDLLERLNRAPALYDLTINPLLLTMIANVHRYRGALPGSRARLYGEICEVMVWRRQEVKRLTTELAGDLKEGLLRDLAFFMMERRVRDLTRSELLNEIEKGLTRVSGSLTAEEFLADVSSNGLLIERESDLYSFAHQTFQEYLAAAYIRDKGLNHILADKVDDTWWRETTLLYAARSDVDLIVEACLRSAAVTALSLAFDCAEQGGRLAPELRARLDDYLNLKVLSRSAPELRALMSGVLMTRHLDAAIRTAGGGRVCVQFVTGKLYSLYQQATRAHDPDSMPPAGEAWPDAPLLGARGTDALNFTQWANQLISGEVAYRLPTLAEIGDPAVQRTLATANGMPSYCAWTENSVADGNPHLWRAPGVEDPYLISDDVLCRSIAVDAAHSRWEMCRLLVLRSIAATEALTRGLDLVETLDFAIDHILDDIFDLSRNLRHLDALGKASGLGTLQDLHSFIELAQQLNHVMTGALAPGRPKSPLAEARTVARILSHELHIFARATFSDDGLVLKALGIAGSLPVVAADDKKPDRTFERSLDEIMGTGLSLALGHVLRRDTDASHWSEEFARTLCSEAGLREASYSVPPDQLSARIGVGIEGIRRLDSQAGERFSRPWLRRVLGFIETEIYDILTQRIPITPEIGTATRLAALCIAAESMQLNERPLAATLREVAAGITLLECRTSGRSEPMEAIVLAVA